MKLLRGDVRCACSRPMTVCHRGYCGLRTAWWCHDGCSRTVIDPGTAQLHGQSRLGADRCASIWLFYIEPREQAAMGGRIDVEADHGVLSFSANFGSVDSLRTCGHVDAARVVAGLEDTLHRSQAPLPPLSPAFDRSSGLLLPSGGSRAPGRQPSAAVSADSGGLPGARGLVSPRPPLNALRHQPRLPHLHTTGFDFARSAHNLGHAAAVGHSKDHVGAHHTCFCSALRSNTMASSRRRSARCDRSQQYSCSHVEKLELPSV